MAEENVYNLEPIVIIPTKSSLLQSQKLRKVDIISAQTIERLPVRSVPELLNHIVGVEIRQRGAQGLQADVNIRGANFEQALICINGVRLHDPQTGHHNMDLPVNLADIERIEILPGPGSSLYGPGAFAGAVNIVTKKPKAKEIAIEASGGNFGLNSQALAISYPLAELNNRFSFARSESSGYRPDTDFAMDTLSFNSERKFHWGSLEYLFGYTDKDFGADSFYSNLYPHEEEHTDTRFFDLKAQIKSRIIELQSDFYYRRHSDKFILDRNRPSWYTNYHTSYSSGADLQGYKQLSFGSMLVGTEAAQEKITSTRLGGHSRDSQSVYAQFASPSDQAMLYNLSLRLDHYQSWGWQSSPSLAFGYAVSPQFSLKASCGRSFRIPSFTDLYYVSPANLGNQDLTPEKAWSGELGLDYSLNQLNAELSYYKRWANDLIGWMRASSSDPWQAENIARVDTQGLGMEITWSPENKSSVISEIRSGYLYQYLESEGASLNAKYTLDYLKHHLHLGLVLSFLADITQTLNLSYKQRLDRRPYFLLDSRISKKIAAGDVDVEIFLDITNLLNTSYSEQEDIAMPGRWVIGGMKIKL